MLKRLVTIGAIVALPLAAGCQRGSSAPEQGAAPDRPASPVATDTRPAAQPTPQPETAASPSRVADASTDPTAAERPGESRNPISKMSEPAVPAAPVLPDFREVTIPAGTLLPVELQTGVSSESSRPEDAVRATLRRPIAIDGMEAVPAGSTLSGVVTAVRRSGRVKGRAHVALRFNSLQAHDERVDVRTGTIGRTAPATKKSDATKIGIGAGAGAVVGAIVGGGSGAAKGAAIGGAGGTGYVLATRGKEVSLPSGTSLSVKLLEPVTVRVPAKR